MILCTLVLRRGEDLVCRSILNQITKQEECCLIGDTHSLLHIVSNDDNRIFFLQICHKILDLGSTDRVKSTGWLIHQQYFRITCKCSCNAQTLLLAAGKTKGTLLETVLQFIKDRRILQSLFNDFVQHLLIADTMNARAIGNVVIDTHREWVWLLEHHANPLAEHIDIEVSVIDVFPVQQNLSFNAAPLDQVIHAVQRAQKRTFAASGRTDECGDFVWFNLYIDIVQCMEVTVPEIHILNTDLTHRLFSLLIFVSNTVGKSSCDDRDTQCQNHKHS